MTLERTIRELNEKLGYNGSYQRKSKYLGKEFDIGQAGGWIIGPGE